MRIVKQIWRHFQTDSLFRNSIYLMASTGVVAVFGFAFWIFVARLFSTRNVGIATTLISAMSLLSSLSLLGFNSSLIRYLPKSQKRNEKINSVYLLVALASVITSLTFLAGLKVFSPHLLFLKTNIFYIITFVFFIMGISLNTIVESIFIAYRASGNVLAKNIVLSVLKLIFPVFFIFLGSYGIFSSVAVATIISGLMGMLLLLYKYAYKPAFAFNKGAIKEMAYFSGGNYIAGFLSSAPSLILPLLIVNLLNAETAAYYYVSSMILSFLVIISKATTQSLLAEGSHDIDFIRAHFFKSLKITFLFLTPAILMIILFGNLILHAFGKNYAIEAFEFLRIVSISALFISVGYLGDSILRLRHKVNYLVGINAFGAIFILAVLYIFIPRGLVAIGWTWLFTQAFLAFVYIIIFWKKKLI